MHGETIKFVSAQQAKLYNTYKNTKLKLLKTNAAITYELPEDDLNDDRNMLERF